MALEDVGDNLTKKMGPFPVWVWGVLIGGAFVVWYWVSQRDAGSSALADAVEETGTVATPSGDFATVPVMPPSDGEVDEATNLEWSVQALNAVTGTGTSLLAAQTAISKYLNGEKLTAAEGQIISRILAKIGAPPEGVSTPDVTPETPATTTTWDTKTGLNAQSLANFNSTVIVNAAVDWVNPVGHTSKPQGKIEISLDNAMTKTFTVLNGKVIRPIVLGKNVSQFKDKAVVVTARFIPSAGAKGKSSTASPITIRIR